MDQGVGHSAMADSEARQRPPVVVVHSSDEGNWPGWSPGWSFAVANRTILYRERRTNLGDDY